MRYVDPHVTILFQDPHNPGRTLQMNGTAVFDSDNTDPFAEVAPRATLDVTFTVNSVFVREERR